jgi:hypothetical protein
MRAGSIVITHPSGWEQQVELDKRTIRVGSASDCDCILASADIAPHHATLACDERDRLVVEICGENIYGQGGLRLTFNLSQITRRRELAWFGDYVLSYQPAMWEQQTEPLRLADLPPNERAVGGAATATQANADQTLLRALLGQNPAGNAHEAPTLAMPLLALAAGDA